MKPKDILKEFGVKTDLWYWCRSEYQQILFRYYDENCIVAHDRNNMGGIFVIKGIKKHFAFMILRGDVWFGGYDYKIARLELKDALKIMNEQNNNCEILDEEEFNKLNKICLLESLNEKSQV